MQPRVRLFEALFCLISVAAGAVVAAEDTTEVLPDKQTIARLIAQLDSNHYATREQATRELADIGPAAIEPLVQTARYGSLESSARAVAILESIYTSGSDDAVDASEAALEQLMQTAQRSIAARADRVLQRHYDVRERRAITEIRKRGGIVRPLRPGGFAAPIRPNNSMPQAGSVVLSSKWKGGDDGLKYVKRLRNLQFLYRVVGNHVSDKAIEDLQIAMPHLNISERGAAFLGIVGNNGRRDCRVTKVDPGTAAAKAGLKPGDVITRFGKDPVANFQMLIELIGKTQPGNKIPVTIRRQQREMQLEVIMGEWGG